MAELFVGLSVGGSLFFLFFSLSLSLLSSSSSSFFLRFSRFSATRVHPLPPSVQLSPPPSIGSPPRQSSPSGQDCRLLVADRADRHGGHAAILRDEKIFRFRRKIRIFSRIELAKSWKGLENLINERGGEESRVYRYFPNASTFKGRNNAAYQGEGGMFLKPTNRTEASLNMLWNLDRES